MLNHLYSGEYHHDPAAANMKDVFPLGLLSFHGKMLAIADKYQLMSLVRHARVAYLVCLGSTKSGVGIIDSLEEIYTPGLAGDEAPLDIRHWLLNESAVMERVVLPANRSHLFKLVEKNHDFAKDFIPALMKHYESKIKLLEPRK